MILKCIWKFKGARIANIVMGKKREEVGRHHIARFIIRLQ